MTKGSGSEFYESNPSQKVKNVSNVPAEFGKARHASNFSEISEDAILSENEHDLSSELGA